MHNPSLKLLPNFKICVFITYKTTPVQSRLCTWDSFPQETVKKGNKCNVQPLIKSENPVGISTQPKIVFLFIGTLSMHSDDWKILLQCELKYERFIKRIPFRHCVISLLIDPRNYWNILASVFVTKRYSEVGGCEAILIKCFLACVARFVNVGCEKGEKEHFIESWANMFRIIKLTTLNRLQWFHFSLPEPTFGGRTELGSLKREKWCSKINL